MENLSTVIICVILAAICVYAVLSYAKKLRSGCCGSGGGEIKVKPSDANAAHYAHKADVYIDGMTCAHCKMRVENAFNGMDGFMAKVNLKKKCAEVFFMKSADEAYMRRVVERAGYTYVKTVYEK